MDERNLLTEIFSNSKLSISEKEKIVGSFTKVVFKKNDFLFQEGKILHHYYFLEEGFVRSFTHNSDFDEVTTNFYSKTEIIIDWTSFMLRAPTQENFQANTDCVCWKLNHSDFQHFFNSIKGFRESGRTRFALSYLKLKQTHLSSVSLTAKERYLKLLEERPDIARNYSLKHIASYLGITDTSLSRIRKEI